MGFDIAPQRLDPISKVGPPVGCHDQLLQHCLRLSSTQCEPFANLTPFKCKRPKKSFWSDGGIDPLDYIYIFKNSGHGPDVPKHWHYVGFGLSDIRGYSAFRLAYERLREDNAAYGKMTQPLPELYPQPPPGAERMNGFGFELTARIKCNSEEEWNSDPPLWPQQILQDLARYVFQSRNTFSVGDHVAWHSPLDSESRDGDSSLIEHILMTLDPGLREVDTTLGPVKFIQIVGVCREELDAARKWNVRGILKMMKEHTDTGGSMLVTDMRRGECIFDLDNENYAKLDRAIEEMGSDMAQISNKHKTSYKKPDWFAKEETLKPGRMTDLEPVTDYHDYAFEDVTVDTYKQEDDYPVRTPSRMSLGSESALKIENAELYDIRYYDNIYILLSYESAKILPVMLQGRLKHKKPFSFQSFKGDSLITFQPEGSSLRSLVSPDRPFAKQIHWLQIYVSNRLREEMYEAIKPDFDTNLDRRPQLPKNFSWPEYNLHLTIVDEIGD